MLMHEPKACHIRIAQSILPARHTVCGIPLNSVQRLTTDFLYNAYMVAAAEEDDIISLWSIRTAPFVPALVLEPGHTGWHIGKLRHNRGLNSGLIRTPADKHGAPRSLCPIPFTVFGVAL